MIPSISIVIAAHNPGPFLVAAIDSLRNQDLPPTEIIVVDDGSTDGSIDGSIAAATSGTAILLVHQERTGPGGARNPGARVATSDALLFLDADDRLTATALHRLAAPLADPQVVMAHGGVREFIDEQYPPSVITRTPADLTRSRIGGATLLRRSFWDAIGPLDTSLARGEWIDWMHRAHNSAANFVQVDDVVLERRLHAGNRTGQGQDLQGYLTVVKAALDRRRGGTTPTSNAV